MARLRFNAFMIWLLVTTGMTAHAQYSRYNVLPYSTDEIEAYVFNEVFDQNPFYSGQVLLPLVAEGDLNNDGNEDFITADLYGKAILIYLRQGTSQVFSLGQVILDTKAISSVNLADLDLDGNQDLIATGRLTGDEDVAVLYGDGTGGFTELKRFQAHTAPIATFTFRRYSGQRPWLACLNYRSRDMDIYEPNGRRDFQRRERRDIGPYPDAYIRYENPQTKVTTILLSSVDGRSITGITLNPRGKEIISRQNPNDLKSVPRSMGIWWVKADEQAEKTQNAAAAKRGESDEETPQVKWRPVTMVGHEDLNFPGRDQEAGAVVLTGSALAEDGAKNQTGQTVVDTVLGLTPIRVYSADMLGDGNPLILIVYASPEAMRYIPKRRTWKLFHETIWCIFQRAEDGSWKKLVQTPGEGVPTNIVFSDIDRNGILDVVYGIYPVGNDLRWRGLVYTQRGMDLTYARSLKIMK